MQKLFENWRFFLKESINNYSGVREEVFRSYVTSANRDAWTDSRGLLRRKVFDDGTPQNIIDEYYDEIILPQIKKVIFNTEVRPAHQSPYGKKTKTHYTADTIWDAEYDEGGMSSEDFQHELGHAIDNRVFLHDAFIKKAGPSRRRHLERGIPQPHSKFAKYLRSDLAPEDDPFNPDYQERDLSVWQKDVLDRAFSLPDRFAGAPHHGLPEEIYQSIINQRQRQGMDPSRFSGAYTAKDIENILSKKIEWAPGGKKWKSTMSHTRERPLLSRDSINYDLYSAIEDFRKKGLSFKEIADILNQIAKVDLENKTTTSIT